MIILCKVSAEKESLYMYHGNFVIQIRRQPEETKIIPPSKDAHSEKLSVGRSNVRAFDQPMSMTARKCDVLKEVTRIFRSRFKV